MLRRGDSSLKTIRVALRVTEEKMPHKKSVFKGLHIVLSGTGEESGTEVMVAAPLSCEPPRKLPPFLDHIKEIGGS